MVVSCVLCYAFALFWLDAWVCLFFCVYMCKAKGITICGVRGVYVLPMPNNAWLSVKNLDTHSYKKCGLSMRMTNFRVHELNAIHPHDQQKNPHSATAIKAAKNRIYSHYILALFSRCRFHLWMLHIYIIMVYILFVCCCYCCFSHPSMLSIRLIDSQRFYCWIISRSMQTHSHTHSEHKYKHNSHWFRFVIDSGWKIVK